MNLIRFNHRPSFSNLMGEFQKNVYNQMEEDSGDIPAVNILDNKDNFLMELAAPGMKKGDFKIKLDNHLLTISSEKKEEKEEHDKNYTRKEFVFNSFSRSFTLPKTVVFDKIKADYKDGVLIVNLPKKEEEAKLSREIKIS